MSALQSARPFVDPPSLRFLPSSPRLVCSLINWVFSLPAFFTIDTFGRRSLLLFTLPFLSFFMFIAGSGFWISDQKGQLGMVVTGVYLFAAFYGPGMGMFYRLLTSPPTQRPS